jgi:hypothetical protein
MQYIIAIMLAIDGATKYSTEELDFSGLIGTECYSDRQIIRIIGFFIKIGYNGGLRFGCYPLQCVLASKPFDHAWSDAVIHTLALYLTR